MLPGGGGGGGGVGTIKGMIATTRKRPVAMRLSTSMYF